MPGVRYGGRSVPFYAKRMQKSIEEITDQQEELEEQVEAIMGGDD